MSEQAADIVAIILETGTKTRRERAAFVARLRDQGLTFHEIGRQVNVSPQRAQQLYTLHKYFERSAKSPFANLSTLARSLLDRMASWHRLPDDWESDPAKIAQLGLIMKDMSWQEATKFRRAGPHTLKEIQDFMLQYGVKVFERFSLGEALDDEEGIGKELTTSGPQHGMPIKVHGGVVGHVYTQPAKQYFEHFAKPWEVYFIDLHGKSHFLGIMVEQPNAWHRLDATPNRLGPGMGSAGAVIWDLLLQRGPLGEALEDEEDLGKEVTGAAVSVEQGMQLITQFLNEKGFTGEFKVWPPGTYKGPYAENAEFVISMSGFMADVWEENWKVVDEFYAVVKSLTLHCEMATRHVLTFYRDTYFDPDQFAPPQTPEQIPTEPVNLRDITFD